jgi:hypothetical protein
MNASTIDPQTSGDKPDQPTAEDLTRWAKVEEDARTARAAYAAAPKLWLLFVTDHKGYHDHALYETYEQAEAALFATANDPDTGVVEDDEPPITDLNDERLDGQLYANILEMAVGFWAEQV